MFHRIQLMVPIAALALAACSSAKPPVNKEPSAPAGPAKGVAQAASPSSDTASVRSFVQDFYDWYVPNVVEDGGYFRVLRERDWVLTTELAASLRADSLAKERADWGNLEGINFDPFLASQDPCARYEAGEIRQKGSNYDVAIHPICNSEYQKSDVEAEVTKQGSSWRFVNFFYEFYPERTDLRKVLCQFAKEARGSVRGLAWQKASC
jgi:hypothetical protein